MLSLHLQHLSLQNEIIYVTRPADKRKVMFYNDKSAQLDLDEDFQKLWRSISVDGMDNDKIKEYLEKQVCFLSLIEAFLTKKDLIEEKRKTG